jgi:hypothetical protein
VMWVVTSEARLAPYKHEMVDGEAGCQERLHRQTRRGQGLIEAAIVNIEVVSKILNVQLANERIPVGRDKSTRRRVTTAFTPPG